LLVSIAAFYLEAASVARFLKHGHNHVEHHESSSNPQIEADAPQAARGSFGTLEGARGQRQAQADSNHHV